ncbi:MAG: hypothetical protein A4E71_03332 [Smithella sp. PtaU1.Bin162]|nr:MAG: hypothetical protein A4E71_03332 [Smithella sp. PtaU1.Bin162]
MQAEITFPENNVRMETANRINKSAARNPLAGFQKFIEEGDWDERLLKYEKHLNRFSLAIIIASVIFLIPVCFNIFTR